MDAHMTWSTPLHRAFISTAHEYCNVALQRKLTWAPYWPHCPWPPYPCTAPPPHWPEPCPAGKYRVENKESIWSSPSFVHIPICPCQPKRNISDVWCAPMTVPTCRWDRYNCVQNESIEFQIVLTIHMRTSNASKFFFPRRRLTMCTICPLIPVAHWQNVHRTKVPPGVPDQRKKWPRDAPQCSILTE